MPDCDLRVFPLNTVTIISQISAEISSLQDGREICLLPFIYISLLSTKVVIFLPLSKKMSPPPFNYNAPFHWSVNHDTVLIFLNQCEKPPDESQNLSDILKVFVSITRF